MNEEYKTLRELDVQPGDVVRNNSARTEIIADTSGDECLMESGIHWLWHNPIWRIVSRASENQKRGRPRASVSPDHAWKVDDTPKPIRDMTDAEIGALVRAKNAGKVIEVWDSVKCAWASAPDPGWYARVPYRISPEPKRETVTLHGSVTDEVWGRGTTEYDTHRITFELIDGEPDFDSIKMEPL